MAARRRGWMVLTRNALRKLAGAVVLAVLAGGCEIGYGVSGRDVGYGRTDDYGLERYSYPDSQSYFGRPLSPGFDGRYHRPKKFEPEKHVKCNRAKKICYEEEGSAYRPSVRETRQYFGRGAAKELKRKLDRE